MTNAITIDDLKRLNAALGVRCGYNQPFYWIDMPDGKRSHFITRGKFAASIAVLRMNYPSINIQLEGSLPPPKKRGKVKAPK